MIAALVIGYVLWGGPAKDRPNRAQVSGTLLAGAVIVPPVVVWGLAATSSRGGGQVNAGGRGRGWPLVD